MKHLAIYSLLLVMLTITACPVLTQNPIDTGSAPVPKWLPGKWAEISLDGNKKGEYFLEKGTKQGNLKCYTIDSTGGKKLSFDPVIVSIVSGRIYLSVYNPADDMSESGYYLFLLERFSEDEFKLTAIDEHAIEYETSSSAITTFLRKNKDGNIYGDKSRYVRSK